MASSITQEVVEISFISPDGDILLLTTEPYDANPPDEWGEYEEIDRPHSIALGIFDLDVVGSTNPDGIWRKRVGMAGRNPVLAHGGIHMTSSTLSQARSAEELLNSDSGLFYEILYAVDGSIYSPVVRLYPQGYTGNSDDYNWTVPWKLTDYQERIHPESLKSAALNSLNGAWYISFRYSKSDQQTRSVEECSQPGVDQTYRDNEVYFQSKYGQTFGTANEVIGGSYTVEESMVSEGEDPKGRVKPVFTKDFGPAGKLNFSVGRHGTDEVAKWFKDRVKDDENTFGHSPDKLNFAFKGTLKLTVTAGNFEGLAQELEFKDVYLAQGHTGAANNWWFGAKGANNPNDGHRWVRAKGKAKTPYGEFDASMYFQRGGQPLTDEKIFIYNASLDALEGNAWMAALPDTTRLQDLVLPGTHHSGMEGKLERCTGGLVGSDMSATQEVSVATQLRMGVRYLDLRVYRTPIAFGSELVCYHRTDDDGQGCDGTPLAKVLDEINSFLRYFKKEFVILAFSHVPDGDVHVVAEAIEKYSDSLYKDEDIVGKGRMVNQLPLGQLRGKMLVVSTTLKNDPNIGFFRKSDYSGSGNYAIFDDYADKNDAQAVIDDQLAKWKSFKTDSRGKGFMLNWICTPRFPDSIKVLAGRLNPALAGNLNSASPGRVAPQVVLLDFATAELVNVIINQNLRNLMSQEGGGGDDGGGDRPPRAMVGYELYPEPNFQGSPARLRIPLFWPIPVWRNIKNQGSSLRFSLEPWTYGRAIAVGGLGLLCFRQYLISKDYQGTGFEMPLLGKSPNEMPPGVVNRVFVNTDARIWWFFMLPYK